MHRIDQHDVALMRERDASQSTADRFEGVAEAFSSMRSHQHDLSVVAYDIAELTFGKRILSIRDVEQSVDHGVSRHGDLRRPHPFSQKILFRSLGMREEQVGYRIDDLAVDLLRIWLRLVVGGQPCLDMAD